MFLINSVVALLLLLSYGLSYVPPKMFSFLSVLSLSVPLLIILNITFGIYWLLKLKKQLLLSVLVLGLGYHYILSFYKFSTETLVSESSFSLMSYNVRLFNLYDWIDDPQIPQKIQNFVLEKAPSILCFQEYDSGADLNFDGYPFSYFTANSSRYTSELAIFSKHKIVSSGTIDFPESSNNAIFADVIIKSDTLRVYNLHLQSSGINPNVEALDSKQSNRLISRLGVTFKAIQQDMGANDDGAFNGQEVTLSAIVTGVYGSNTSIQDGEGAWSGMFVYVSGGLLDDTVQVAVGDSVIVAGQPQNHTGVIKQQSIARSNYWPLSRPSPADLELGILRLLS